MATYVLVHGSWDGGWAWRDVGRILQDAGHDVYRPTLTGQGERAHLASPEIDLHTHIMDVTNVLRYEKLEDVMLVGNSYGGMVITGVAEQAPDQIRRLVYLDGFLPQDGDSVAALLGPELVAFFEQAAAQFDGWRIPHNPPDADRRTWAFLKTLKQPLAVRNPEAARLPHTYIHHTGKGPKHPFTPLFACMADRARTAGWTVREMPAWDHYPILDKPQEVAALLLEYA